jgi:hypothetical protein
MHDCEESSPRSQEGIRPVHGRVRSSWLYELLDHCIPQRAISHHLDQLHIVQHRHLRKYHAVELSADSAAQYTGRQNTVDPRPSFLQPTSFCPELLLFMTATGLWTFFPAPFGSSTTTLFRGCLPTLNISWIVWSSHLSPEILKRKQCQTSFPDPEKD